MITYFINYKPKGEKVGFLGINIPEGTFISVNGVLCRFVHISRVDGGLVVETTGEVPPPPITDVRIVSKCPVIDLSKYKEWDATYLTSRETKPTKKPVITDSEKATIAKTIAYEMILANTLGEKVSDEKLKDYYKKLTEL